MTSESPYAVSAGENRPPRSAVPPAQRRVLRLVLLLILGLIVLPYLMEPAGKWIGGLLAGR